MASIRMYLANDMLPADSKEADRVERRANYFMLYDGIWYK